MLVDTCNHHGTDILLLLPKTTVVPNKYLNTFGKVLQYPFDTVHSSENVSKAPVL